MFHINPSIYCLSDIPVPVFTTGFFTAIWRYA